MPRISYSYDVSKKVVPTELQEELGCYPTSTMMHMALGHPIRLTIVKEYQRITLVDLFGLVGGYLGLFVGVSMITVLEMIEFVLVSLFDRLRGKTAKIGEMSSNSNGSVHVDW